MIRWLETAFRTYLLHPLHANGYQWWSGLGSGSAWLAGIGVYVTHHNCHIHRCWRLGHPDPTHGHPVCKRHAGL